LKKLANASCLIKWDELPMGEKIDRNKYKEHDKKNRHKQTRYFDWEEEEDDFFYI
jgi:hypothetical protein